MTKPITIPNTFASATSTIPLSQLDTNFSTISASLNDPATYASYAADTGVANAYVVNLDPAPSSLSSIVGLIVTFQPTYTNTGSATLNLNALGVINIVNYDSTALSANQIQAGSIVALSYNGTNFILVGSGGTGAVAGGAIFENKNTISSSYTVSTNKNAMSVGPMTIATGVVVTVPAGSRYIVL